MKAEPFPLKMVHLRIISIASRCTSIDSPIQRQRVYHQHNPKGSKSRIREKVFINPRKATSLSWFKGAFIQIPEKAMAAGEPTKESKKKETKPIQTENDGGKESNPNDPFYWPLNPRVPIY